MKLKGIASYLKQKNKLSLRNVRTGQEIWHLFVSRINLLLAIMAVFLVFFIGVLTLVAYTPVLDLIPGYPGSRSREALVENIVRLDSLSREVSRWEEYHDNLALIMDGQSPAASTDTTQRQGIKGTVSDKSNIDSVLREQMRQGQYRLETGEDVRKKAESTFEMLPPVKGAVVSGFNPQDGIYGVELAPSPNQPVLSVLDGTVIQTSWSPENGNSVVVQHSANIVSVYRGLKTVLKKRGERIKAGEPIAVVGQSGGDAKVPHLLFELWYNGNAVDPDDYITFQYIAQ